MSGGKASAQTSPGSPLFVARLRGIRGPVACACLALVVLLSPTATAASPVVVDRVAVRYFTPETGGAGKPRFITERELAFFTRVLKIRPMG